MAVRTSEVGHEDDGSGAWACHEERGERERRGKRRQTGSTAGRSEADVDDERTLLKSVLDGGESGDNAL